MPSCNSTPQTYQSARLNFKRLVLKDMEASKVTFLTLLNPDSALGVVSFPTAALQVCEVLAARILDISFSLC